MNKKIDPIIDILNSHILGRKEAVKISFASLIVGGHILIEDRPGVGKTTLARLLAKISGLEFNRIQFTSDLLPSDILGFLHLDSKAQDFVFKKGPIFTDILLADEINRGSSRTQSAFLQAMEEREISIENIHHKLSDHFCVMATQNQLDHVGTHALPESQLDRFCISMFLGPNTREIEKLILKRPSSYGHEVEQLLTAQDFLAIKKEVQEVVVNEACYDFTLDIVDELRKITNKHISIRASQDMVKLSKCIAYFDKRDFVTPKDIRFVAPYCLAHRIVDGDSIEYTHKKVQTILETISDKI